MNAYFPSRLYQLRKERGETQGEIGKMFGMTRANVSAYEKGKSIPPYDKVVVLAHHFGVSVDYLLGQSDKRNAPEEEPSEEKTVDVMQTLRILKSDVKDRNKRCYLNGKRLSDNERQDVCEVIGSIIKIMEKMQ